ncbi:MAG: hypothetical protein WBL63_10165 [Candidatus Acidiferrum sp.]
MRKHCVRILSVFFTFAALAITARGQAVDHVVANIPFEFVVAGKTLPAGTYTVQRLNDQDNRTLVMDSFKAHVSVLVVSSEARHTFYDKPALSFEQVGDQRLLSKIETASSIYTIPVSRTPTLEAATKTQSGTSARVSGGRGGN